MLKNIFKGSAAKLRAHNENAPVAPEQEAAVDPAKVRALATGAALAVSLDTSPAVLVSIYDYAHRYRDRPRRTA
jgi:myo-inositol-hexaphosphate 3-phosphohydrolase